MPMIEFGDYYINPKHISCVGMKEENVIGTCKYLYEVFVICGNQKIAKSCRTRSEAKELVQRIITCSNQSEVSNGSIN